MAATKKEKAHFKCLKVTSQQTSVGLEDDFKTGLENVFNTFSA